MKILSTLLVAALFALASCSSDKTADTTNTPTENTTAAPTTAPTTGTADVPATDPNMQMQSQPQMQTAQPAQQPAASGDVALNPPHGQPGHRCDIAVGAPLNSAPAAQQPQTIQVQ